MEKKLFVTVTEKSEEVRAEQEATQDLSHAQVFVGGSVVS